MITLPLKKDIETKEILKQSIQAHKALAHLNGVALHRQTASKYLKEIEKIDILQEVKIGRNRYFVNLELFDLLKKAVNS